MARKQAPKHRSATDLLAGLAQQQGKVFAYVGIIDRTDDEQSIRFSPGISCRHWSKIPVEFIERADFMRDVYCGDHKHHLVYLRMRAPETSEGKLFATLAQQHGAYAQSISSVTFPQMDQPTLPQCPPGSHWDRDTNGNPICVPDRG